ncbi:MAG: spermidine synthase [Bacillota bacterium]
MSIRALVFTGGAALMALELVGSRVLAPYFGNSIFVWGSLIGMFMAALAGGYYAGGRLADRWPSRRLFEVIVLVAGLCILAVPLYSETFTAWAAGRGLGPKAGPLLAATVLFALPSLLLGTLSPFALKLATKDIAVIGNTAGALYALSTAGSIAGTFITSFWLIPAFSVRLVIQLIGVTLAVLAGADLVATSRRKVSTALVLLFLVTALAAASPLGGVLGAALPQERVIFDRETLYHHVRVVDRGDSRYLRFDNSWQSGMYLSDPDRARFTYTDFFHLALVWQPHPSDALFIGLGGGSAPKAFLKDYPDLRVDVAEIDPVVIDVARRFFDVPTDPRLNMAAQDGRLFLKGTPRSYDLIALDAYYADAVPFHLFTREFFTLAGQRLKPEGVLAVNVIGAFEGAHSNLLRSIYRTIKEVFPEVYLFAVPLDNSETPGSIDPGLERNIIVMATKGGARLSPDEVQARAEGLAASGVLKSKGLADDSAYLYSGSSIRTDDVPVLTDEYAPVDSLLHLK